MEGKTAKTQETATPVHEAQRRRNAAARQLLQKWLADDSGYDEETWPFLKQALEENRVSAGSFRKLFRD